MGPGAYDVHYENHVKLGQFLCKEDGFYDFWPELNGGFWDEHILLSLATALNELNEEWQHQIDNDPKIGENT